MRILIDFKDLSEGSSSAAPSYNKRDRKSDGIDPEGGPPQIKSTHSELSVVQPGKMFLAGILSKSGSHNVQIIES